MADKYMKNPQSLYDDMKEIGIDDNEKEAE